MLRTKRATDAVLKELREFGLAYPGAHTKSPWPDHLDLAVNDKTFAYLSIEGEPFGISCKLPQSNAAALMLPFAKPTGYGLGKSGWVSAQFPEGQMPPTELLKGMDRRELPCAGPEETRRQPRCPHARRREDYQEPPEKLKVGDGQARAPNTVNGVGGTTPVPLHFQLMPDTGACDKPRVMPHSIGHDNHDQACSGDRWRRTDGAHVGGRARAFAG